MSAPSERFLKHKVAGMFVLMGFLLAFLCAGSVLGIASWNGKASKSSVTAVAKVVNPSEAALRKQACTAFVAWAAPQGVLIDKCVTKNITIKGDKAVATVVFSSSAQGIKGEAQVFLSKGVWRDENIVPTKVEPLK